MSNKVKMHPDTNAKPIPVVFPVDRDYQVTASTQVLAEGVWRLCAATGSAQYGFEGTANIHLPQEVIEYIRVDDGVTCTVLGTIDFVRCQ